MRTLLFVLLAMTASAGTPRVIAVNINGVVHPVTAEIVANAIAQAQRENASAILLRLNTPGGLLEATRQINVSIAASPVPILAWVGPGGSRAASAGFLILQAADVAAMAPGANTGAASPVLMYGEMDKVMRAKAENDLAASVRATAQKRGRNTELAEKAVREAASFTSTEALANHVVDLIASSERELLDHSKDRAGRSLSGAEIIEYQLTLRERLVSATSDPNVAFILLALGALGIYVEFSAPGLIFPGVIGGILAILGLNGLSIMPINWAGAGLLILAIVMFVLEAKIASHGILGIGGAVAMTLGAVMLIDAPPDLRIRTGTALSVTLPFALITILLVTLALRARHNKVITGKEGMLGEIGVAYTPLDPGGKVFIRGEYWDAHSSRPAAKGDKVKVNAVVGLLLEVEPR